MDELTTKLLEYLDGIEDAVVTNAPKAYELAVRAVQMDAIAELVASLAWIATAAMVAFVVAGNFKSTGEKAGETWERMDPPPRLLLALLFRIAGSLVLAINFLMATSNKHIWFGLFSPELEMVRQLYLNVVGVPE